MSWSSHEQLIGPGGLVEVEPPDSTLLEVRMARRSPQTAGKRERERMKLEKRERKQQKKADAAAARAGEEAIPEADRQGDDVDAPVPVTE
jgi:hypothetical protein